MTTTTAGAQMRPSRSERARRRTRPLTPATVRDVPAPCVTCTVWESGLPGDDADAKAAWVRRVSTEWGACGRILDVDGVSVGYVSYAPAAYLTGPPVVDVRNISDDAVCLAGLRVTDAAPRGAGRLLVQAAVRDLATRRDVRAIEAFGWAGVGGGGCLVPVGFLTDCGFTVVQDHPRLPRMRLDLRRVLTVPPLVHTADEAWRRLREVAGHVRPGRPEADPPPATRDTWDPGRTPPGVC